MRIAILGYGVEGKSAYNYFYGKYPDAEFVIYDEAHNAKLTVPEDVETRLGTPLKGLSIDADIVVRSPAINPHHITTQGVVTSVTKEFFHECPAPIIGITGTKGKGTTASLIYSILTAGGKKSWLVGNIGTGALDILPQLTADDVVVYELSSFQLWDMDQSPEIAVVLMLEADHLDVHNGMDDYLAAKANIRKYQNDGNVCYYHPTNKLSERVATVNGTHTTYAYRYGIKNENHTVAYIDSNTFFIQDDPICSVDSLQIPGKHNQENACAAISAAYHFVKDSEVIERGLQSFTGLPHRLKLVEEVDGVQYIDDSIATTPGSAIAAIRAFDQPKILILGGSDKGADFGALYDEVVKSGIKQVITIGTMSHVLAGELLVRGYDAVTQLGMTTMAQIVETARQAAVPGDVVIMSPACASFDMFKSYTDRGEQFIAAVNSYKK